jgi:hypothetical protein
LTIQIGAFPIFVLIHLSPLRLALRAALLAWSSAGLQDLSQFFHMFGMTLGRTTTSFIVMAGGSWKSKQAIYLRDLIGAIFIRARFPFKKICEPTHWPPP